MYFAREAGSYFTVTHQMYEHIPKYRYQKHSLSRVKKHQSILPYTARGDESKLRSGSCHTSNARSYFAKKKHQTKPRSTHAKKTQQTTSLSNMQRSPCLIIADKTHSCPTCQQINLRHKEALCKMISQNRFSFFSLFAPDGPTTLGTP